MAARRPSEPLPRYARDPETSSVHSAAPSYTSAAPSYHSAAQPSNGVGDNLNGPSSPSAYPRRLSSAHFAPGYTARSANPDIRDLEAHSYNIAAWSSSSGPQARHYASVAQRRATIASASAQQAALRSAAMMSASRLPAIGQTEPSKELDPLEDPFVVGTQMAEVARQERMKRMMRGDAGLEVLKSEDKKWDFMISQMADWKERERSWQCFRKEMERKKGFLRRRVGIIGSI